MARSAWIATPVLAAAVLGLVACSPPGQTNSDAPGTTPPVWTGAASAGSAPGDHSKHGRGHDARPGASATAELKDSAGASVGAATFTDMGTYVGVRVEAKGLTPGFHGLHVHQKGVCEGDFKTAGGHLQVGPATEHPASGDLTSLEVRKDGSALLMTTTDTVSLHDLTEDGGRAIIVHAAADNFGNIPGRYAPAGADAETMATGDAGARVACGVIK